MSLYSDLVNSLSPKHYWRLGETSGTTAIDESGNQNGIYENAVALGEPSLLAGDNNPSVRFQTDPDIMRANHDITYWKTNASIVFNIKVNSATNSNNARVISIGDNGTGQILIGIGTNISNFFVAIFNSPAIPFFSGQIIVGDIYHIAIVHEGTLNVISVYVNGVKVVNSASFFENITGTGFSIAGDDNQVGEFADVTLDEVFILDRVLTNVEIESVYNASIARVGKSITGNIVENLAADLWDIASYDLNSKELIATKTQGSGDFELQIPIAHENTPQFVTVLPVQGTPWVASLDIALNSLVYPTNPEINPYYFKCTTNGTTGGSEPAWTTAPASTVNDGTVVWELVERMVQPITHSPIIPL